MRFYERTLKSGSQTGAFDESTTASLVIPRDRLISQMGLCVSATVVNAAMAVRTLTKRQLYSIFDKISLNVNGGAGSLAGIQGGEYYDHIKMQLGRDPTVFVDGVPVDRDDAISVGSAATVVITFEVPIFFRDQLGNDLDVSCLLDSRSMSSLDLEYTTRSGFLPAQADLTITGASSSTTLYLKEVYATNDELKALNAANGYPMFYNVFYREQRNLSLTSSTSFTQKFDMQVQYIHDQITFHPFDSSAADWVSAIVSEIYVKNTLGNVGDIDHLRVDMLHSQLEDSLSTSSSPSKGTTMWNCSVKTGGLDTRGLKSGDLTVAYSTGATFAAGDSLSILYKSKLPAQLS